MDGNDDSCFLLGFKVGTSTKVKVAVDNSLTFMRLEFFDKV